MPVRVKLMFEWRGGTLWCDSEEARDRFGVGPIEDVLPLDDALRARLEALGEWHDTALNWDDPASPGPWTPEEEDRFEQAAREVLEAVRAALGPGIEVRYRSLLRGG